MPDLWLCVVLIWIATHRLTRIVTRDTFPPIQNTIFWLQDCIDREWFVKLTSCDWCMSIWIGAILSFGTMVIQGLIGSQAYSWIWWVFIWLGASSFTGLLANKEGSDGS